MIFLKNGKKRETTPLLLSLRGGKGGKKRDLSRFSPRIRKKKKNRRRLAERRGKKGGGGSSLNCTLIAIGDSVDLGVGRAPLLAVLVKGQRGEGRGEGKIPAFH